MSAVVLFLVISQFKLKSNYVKKVYTYEEFFKYAQFFNVSQSRFGSR